MRIPTAVLALLLATLLAPSAFSQDEGNQSAPSPEPRPMRIRVGGNVAQASLTHMVQPIYPPIAKAAHVSGTVILHAIVGTDGKIQDLELVSGPPLLVKAAMDAVKQWVYQPTLLNGKPVEVDTTVSVVFTLSDSPPPPESPASIDPQLKADVQQLMEVSRLREREVEIGHVLFQAIRPALLVAIPPTPNREKILEAYGEKLVSVLQSQDAMDRIAGAYAKYFTDEDIKAITQFYQTPAGSHFLEAAPKFAGELFAIGQGFAQQNLGSILGQLCREFPELQGVAKFCPEGPAEKKSLLLEPHLPSAAGTVSPHAGK